MSRNVSFEPDLDRAGRDDGPPVVAVAPSAFVADVLERSSAGATPPAPPTPTTANRRNDGFPEHRRQSRFKRRGLDEAAAGVATTETIGRNVGGQPDAPSTPQTFEQQDRQRIDLENRERLANMSSEEIEQARRELMENLPPAMLQRLLKQSNIDSGSAESNLASPHDLPAISHGTAPIKADKPNAKTVSFVDPPSEKSLQSPQSKPDPSTADNEDTIPSPASDPDGTNSTRPDTLPNSGIHFPRPQQPPDLDPSSSTFLTDLHTKYFPSLPSEPSKLEWMRERHADSLNPYDPSAAALKAQDIRFAFTGALLAPRTAAEIPVTEGLHHHADAPDAAGYTIAELAHLSRSAFAPQRCLAFQTLGRILFRLGSGEFGDAADAAEGTVVARAEDRDSLGELARGLWSEVHACRVLDTLVAESEGRGVDGGRHVSARAYATEAVWLWRKGGGRRWKAD